MNIKKLITNLGLKKTAKRVLDSYLNLFPNQVVVRDGITYSLDCKQLIDRSIFLGGWERDTINVIKKYITDNSQVIEVGSNIGAHTLIMAKQASRGRVFAFEPTHFARTKLKKNISLNKLNNIEVYDYLITDNNLNTPNREIKSSWTVNKENAIAPESNKSEAISLDQFMNMKKFNGIDFLKIDVDGYDFKVLDGSSGLIKKFKPIIFIELCEYTLNAQGDSITNIFKLLGEFSYKAFAEDGALFSDAQQVINIVGKKSSVNGLFIPQQ